MDSHNSPQTSVEAAGATIEEKTTIDTSTGEISIVDPLDGPEPDLALISNIIPEKASALALWSLTDQQMSDMSLEEFISSATTARALNDFSNWILGRLARGVQKQYGQDSLGEFAKEIGVPKNTLAVYRWVAEVFKDAADTDLTLMPFTAYIVAAGTDNPLDWILQASNENWSIEKLKYEIDTAKGKIQPDLDDQPAKPKLVKCELCTGWRIINTDQLCHCDNNVGVDGEL